MAFSGQIWPKNTKKHQISHFLGAFFSRPCQAKNPSVIIKIVQLSKLNDYGKKVFSKISKKIFINFGHIMVCQ
jgi:hypothetical protein